MERDSVLNVILRFTLILKSKDLKDQNISTHHGKTSICLLAILLIFATNAIAEDRRPRPEDFTVGLDTGAILKAWGPPSFRQEKETLRQEKWHYGDVSIVIKEGKISSVGELVHANASLVGPPSASSHSISPRIEKRDELGATELLKELSTLDSGPSDSGPPNSPNYGASGYGAPPSFSVPTPQAIGQPFDLLPGMISAE